MLYVIIIIVIINFQFESAVILKRINKQINI
jgi:hypothetical protein